MGPSTEKLIFSFYIYQGKWGSSVNVLGFFIVDPRRYSSLLNSTHIVFLNNSYRLIKAVKILNLFVPTTNSSRESVIETFPLWQ